MRMTIAGQAAPAAARELATRPAMLPAWLGLLSALAGGLCLAAAFPPAGFWPLAAVGPALLVIALAGRRLRFCFVAGLLFGAAFFFPLLAWLVNLAWYVWTALAVSETLIFAVLVLGQRLLLRLRAWPLAVAGWWVLAEAIRDRWPWEGFPWGRLAMSQATAPTVRWVAIGGPPLLTFLLALAGASLAWLVLGPLDRSRSGPGQLPLPRLPDPVRARLWPAVSLVLVCLLALAGALLPVDPGSAHDPTAELAAVQGNVPHARNLPTLWRATTVTQNHAAATEQYAAQVRAGRRPAPDLVIWPENSTDQDPSSDPYIYGSILSAVNDIGRPVLVGAVLQNPQRNAGQLWLPGRGPVAVYVKRRLVPFGEVIPFRGFLELFTSLPKLQPQNFVPGHKAVIFKVGKIRLGDVICYEVGFDGLVSSEVAAGANLLAVQTNDADFELDGQTGETEQQLDMARIRAVEHDRAVAVASTTGISAIIAPDGSLVAQSRLWTRAVVTARVPLRTNTTLADRIGGWPEGLLTFGTLAALCLALAGAVQDRRRRRAAARPEGAAGTPGAPPGPPPGPSPAAP
jgi:apolipoprotein N-acyltransferase